MQEKREKQVRKISKVRIKLFFKFITSPVPSFMSPVSRPLSNLPCVTSPVSFPLSDVSYLKSPVSCLLSHVPCLNSCLLSPV